MSFRRANLGYMALAEDDKMGRMLRMINKLGGSGVVYVRNRRETQEIAQFLVNHGVSADFYHAGLEANVRSLKQDSWMDNKVRVIVATNAFGMGIDKPDVRFVLHLDIPDSLEAYYQEAGRAGRDGKKAFPVLMYQQADRNKLWENFEASYPSVKFIQHVYHHLGNYFQIAYGAGKGSFFDFDIVDFCKRYQIEILPTMSALKFLEKDGWISVSEAVFIPSRFKFEVDYQELYKFQVQSAKYDPLIKLILRTYGGVFEFYVPLHEYEFAKKLKTSYSNVVDMLISLQKLQLASYLPKTDAPQLEFLQARVDYKNLFIDAAFIQERKIIKETQLKAIYAYLDDTDCRSKALQRYFGEQDDTYCEVCDLCLMRAHRSGIEQKLREEIKNLLVVEQRSIKQLVDDLTAGNDEMKVAVIRELLDEEHLILENGLYRWNTVF
jgi:ATP-dependent DNA helicase RecQ